MKILFDGLNKRDARLLRNWWDAHTLFYHFIDRDGIVVLKHGRRHRLWRLIRQ